jgi:hypothetical protein
VFCTTMGKVVDTLEHDIEAMLALPDEDLEVESGLEPEEQGEELFGSRTGLTRVYYLLEASPQAGDNSALAKPLLAVLKVHFFRQPGILLRLTPCIRSGTILLSAGGAGRECDAHLGSRYRATSCLHASIEYTMHPTMATLGVP